MTYEMIVLPRYGTALPARRIDAATVRTALAQAAVDGTRLRIRPTATGTDSAEDTPTPPQGRPS